MHKEAHWERSRNSINWWLIDTLVCICRKDNPHNCKCDIRYVWFWIQIVQFFFEASSLFPYMALFTSIKIQNKFLMNSRKPKMKKPSNNVNNSFWSALYSSSLMILMLKSSPSYVLVLLSDVMDGLGSSFSPHNPTCMLTASNKSSNNTVMRDSVLNIVLLNDVSLEFAVSTLTA